MNSAIINFSSSFWSCSPSRALASVLVNVNWETPMSWIILSSSSSVIWLNNFPSPEGTVWLSIFFFLILGWGWSLDLFLNFFILNHFFDNFNAKQKNDLKYLSNTVINIIEKSPNVIWPLSLWGKSLGDFWSLGSIH